METHSSMINCDSPGNIKRSEKMKTAKVSSFHKLYDCERNNEEFFRRLSSNSTSQQDLAASGNKVLFDLNKTSKRKQPNTEMREKILANMSKALQENMTKKYGEQFSIDELPCGEGGKWIKIRMYQERARRREARRRRQREKEREGSRGRKSKKRKSRKSRKGKKGRKRSKSRGRSKSKGRKKSRKSRRKSKSRSRKKSRSGSRRRSGSRKRSVKSNTRGRRRRRT